MLRTLVGYAILAVIGFFLLNVVFGTAVGSGLYLIGVPNPILWGILATTLRFIPYIGPWIAAATSRASSSRSKWSRKKPESPSRRITRSSSSSLRSASGRSRVPS